MKRESNPADVILALSVVCTVVPLWPYSAYVGMVLLIWATVIKKIKGEGSYHFGLIVMIFSIQSLSFGAKDFILAIIVFILLYKLFGLDSKKKVVSADDNTSS